MSIVYLRETGGMEDFKVISFHATTTGVMFTFGKMRDMHIPTHYPPHGAGRGCIDIITFLCDHYETCDGFRPSVYLLPKHET